jgi:polyisoprenoid-binding protein YceI
VSLLRIVVGAVTAVVVLFVAVGAGWWFFIREDNELATESPAIPTELVETTASAGSDGSLTFRIIPDRSEAAYFADEKLASLPLPSTAKGSTQDITGEFHLTEDGFDLDPTRTSTFTVDLTTLKSDRDMRDNRVRNDGLQVDRFPTATFTATSVSGVQPDLPEGEEQTFQLTGIMDLHGVQKELTWEVKARLQGNVMTALATVNFRYEEFNIPVLNIANFVSVEDDVTLQVQVVAEAG